MAAKRQSLRIGVVGAPELCNELEQRPGLTLLRDITELDGSVDAVLLELGAGASPAAALDALRDLTVAPVVMLAAGPSSELADWAAHAEGVDVLVHPYDIGGVQFALEKAGRSARRVDVAPGGAARVVTVFSPKGGTGKSVVAANLATAIARRGSGRTLLVDLDLQFGDAAIMLGIGPRQTLAELVASPAALDAEKLDVYTERHPSGLSLLAAPLRPEEAELIDDEAVRGVLGLARATYDAVVVDTPPLFDGATLVGLDLTDELLLVCTPDIPTMKNVRLALDTLDQLSLAGTRVRIVLNRLGEQGGLSRREVEEAFGREVDFVLPFDRAVALGVNRGAPAVLRGADGSFAQALLTMARSLFPEGWPPAPAPRRLPSRGRLLALARS